jgi:hypothetical protein
METLLTPPHSAPIGRTGRLGDLERELCIEHELERMSFNKVSNLKMKYVYVVYDPCVTSIRGIFKTRQSALTELEKLKDFVGCVMKIPLDTVFSEIDESKLCDTPDYLCDEN